MNRRELLTGAAALAAYNSLSAPADALSLSQSLELLGTVGIPAPPSGNGYVFFNNSGGSVQNQPLGNLAITFTDASGLTRPITAAGGS